MKVDISANFKEWAELAEIAYKYRLYAARFITYGGENEKVRMNMWGEKLDLWNETHIKPDNTGKSGFNIALVDSK